VLTAAVELFHLASGRLMAGDMCASARLHLSSPLAQVLEGVFSLEPGSGFDNAEGLASSLSGLPPALVGTEATVAEELRRLVADLLDERRQKLASLRGAAPPQDVDGPTRVFSAFPSEQDADAVEEPTREFHSAQSREPPRRPRGVVEPERPRPEPPPPPVRQAERASVGLPVSAPQPLPRIDPRPKRRSRHLLLERSLMGVLVVLVAIAVGLAVTHPERLRLVVEDVKSLR
jgi:hypothetical protein